MNQTQKTAALAIAAYETALAAFTSEADQLEQPAGDDFDAPEWDAYEDQVEAIRAQHDLDELSTLRIAAEDLLLDWSIGTARKLATPAQAADLDMLAANKWRPSIRAKLIDLALRLNA